MTFIELLKELNTLDEHPTLEAKSCAGDQIGKSFFETVCAFSNEPGQGGGRILLGVAKNKDDFFGGYEVIGVGNPDKIQLDIASGCSEKFNIPIRPRFTVEEHENKVVLIVEIEERAPSDKPVHFVKTGLPSGAWRRIGSSDQRCTDEDMVIFYGNRSGESYDLSILSSAELSDFDPDAIEHYRNLRRKVNSEAEELSWSDADLLQALSAIKRENGTWKPTLTGLLLFGSRMALRRELPMVRVDYIRVAGNEWVSDPDQRFEKTIDMRGPLLELVDRILAAVMDDLPKGFELKEGDVQAKTPTLPSRALREAIVNALMHRSYREHRPTQVIRYSNRIEINNAGFSLKNEDLLGETGSQLRNPTLAAVFHDTNTAETKGSGLRTMRRLMRDNGFSLPTFESKRADNYFVSRFLMHHFLSESDLKWLHQIPHTINEPQRMALIFIREQGAIDNQTLRQLTGGDVLVASQDLRRLRELNLITPKGKGSATYYLRGHQFPSSFPELRVTPLNDNHDILEPDHGTLETNHDTLETSHGTLDSKIPEDLQARIALLGARPGNKIRPILLELCAIRAFSVVELSTIMGKRNPRALKADHLNPLIKEKKLQYLYPDMEKHPKQAYLTIKNS